jgi:hypothetical protein
MLRVGRNGRPVIHGARRVGSRQLVERSKQPHVSRIEDECSAAIIRAVDEL